MGSLGIPAGVPWLPVSWLQFLNRRWQFHDVTLSTYVDNAYHAVAIDEQRPQFAPTLWEQQPNAVNQVLQQVWFAGVHTNVGGGNRDGGLSDITLLWMIDKAKGCGLSADLQQLEHLGTENIAVEPNIRGRLDDSRTGLYRLFPAHVRPIGTGQATKEAAHQAAVSRMETSVTPPYRPANLQEYLEAGGTVVSE